MKAGRISPTVSPTAVASTEGTAAQSPSKPGGSKRRSPAWGKIHQNVLAKGGTEEQAVRMADTVTGIYRKVYGRK